VLGGEGVIAIGNCVGALFNETAHLGSHGATPRLDVETGDRVRTGQIVGVMATDVERPPELHVEVRRHGRPVNPLPWLAASSNKVRG